MLTAVTTAQDGVLDEAAVQQTVLIYHWPQAVVAELTGAVGNRH